MSQFFGPQYPLLTHAISVPLLLIGLLWVVGIAKVMNIITVRSLLRSWPKAELVARTVWSPLHNLSFSDQKSPNSYNTSLRMQHT